MQMCNQESKTFPAFLSQTKRITQNPGKGTLMLVVFGHMFNLTFNVFLGSPLPLKFIS